MPHPSYTHIPSCMPHPSYTHILCTHIPCRWVADVTSKVGRSDEVAYWITFKDKMKVKLYLDRHPRSSPKNREKYLKNPLFLFYLPEAAQDQGGPSASAA